MHKMIFGWGLFAASLAIGASAQTNTFPSSGNVGIGTTSPGYALVVGNGGVLRVDGPTSATGTAFSIGGYGSVNVDAPYVSGGRFTITNTGSVGIGAPSPVGIFQITEPNADTGNWINFYNNVGANGGAPPQSMNTD